MSVHELERSVGLQLLTARHHPTHERRGLVRVAKSHESVKRERRVANPRIAVVPVAHAAECLGQPERGCGHDRPVLSGGEQLQHERRTVHHFAPAVLVRATADPAAPKIHGFLEGVARVFGARAGRRLVRHHDLEDEPRRFVGAEGELGHGGSLRELHRDRRAQPQRQLARSGAANEQDLRVAALLDGVRRAGVVESWIAAHLETDVPTDGLRATHDVVRDAGVLHWHEIRDLGDAAVRQEPGEQHIRVRQVQLPVDRVVELRRDLEAAAAAASRRAAKTEGESNDGRQRKSIDPFFPTSATV